jgi:hypothetical protein
LLPAFFGSKDFIVHHLRRKHISQVAERCGTDPLHFLSFLTAILTAKQISGNATDAIVERQPQQFLAERNRKAGQTARPVKISPRGRSEAEIHANLD